MTRLLCKGLLFSATTLGLLAQAPAGGAGGGQSPGGAGSMPSRSSAPDATNPGGVANNPDTMTQKVDDKKFAQDAAAGGMMEVAMGKLAAEKGSSDGVKQYGQKLVDDHTKANDQLKEIASKEKIDIPSAVTSKQQSMLDKLGKLSGPQFDKAFVKDAVKDHQHDISDFQREAQNGTNPNIKQFAASTLPTLKEHLDMAKDLHSKSK